MTTKPTGDDLHSVFARSDLGGDDRLDLMEFGMVLDSLGLSWTRAEVQDRFERADTNRDGFISLPELRALLETQGWAEGVGTARA
ncbi:EF-hand domain-containing protein [Spirillospora sp. NPDC029432]|uniref:EF-hand domain-containing protein n=1 Tax=Spirillospora sp. NPDC029432 TaxID=3154599 RepID=UPI0034561B8C